MTIFKGSRVVGLPFPGDADAYDIDELSWNEEIESCTGEVLELYTQGSQDLEVCDDPTQATYILVLFDHGSEWYIPRPFLRLDGPSLLGTIDESF